jgi:DNA-binding LacI/PurR family transcriptional regulator
MRNKRIYRLIHRRPAAMEAAAIALRDAINTGEFKPGSRLPSQRDLIARLQISGCTLQRTINMLKQEGFLETRRREGTLVQPHPPGRFRFGLLFFRDPSDLEPGPWPNLFAALEKAAKKIQADGPWQFERFYDVNEHMDSDSCKKLLADMGAHRLAGLVFCSSPHRLLKTPLLADDGLPRVCLMSQSARPHLPAVWYDLGALVEGSLDIAEERGWKRVAMISLSRFDRASGVVFQQRAEARGMISPSYWSVPLDFPGRGASVCTHLLLASGPRTRPEALFVADDCLLDGVLEGVRAAGLRPGRDVDVISHGHLPLLEKRTPGVTYLCFDDRAVLQSCIAMLQKGRPAGASETLLHAPLRLPARIANERN